MLTFPAPVALQPQIQWYNVQVSGFSTTKEVFEMREMVNDFMRQQFRPCMITFEQRGTHTRQLVSWDEAKGEAIVKGTNWGQTIVDWTQIIVGTEFRLKWEEKRRGT